MKFNKWKWFIIPLFLLLGSINLRAQGSKWRNFTSRPEVSAIAIHGNYVWVGTEYSGLVKIDRKTGKEEFYNHSNSGLPYNEISSIAVDSGGNVWIVTKNKSGVLTKFDGTNWSVYNSSNSGIPDVYIQCITIDKHNDRWLGAYTFLNKKHHGNGTWNCLIKFGGKKWDIYDSSNSAIIGRVECIAEDRNGTKWVGTNNGLVEYDGMNWITFNKLSSGLPSNSIMEIVIDTSGNKLIRTDKCIVQFNGKNWKVYEVAVDTSGNEFVCTKEKTAQFDRMNLKVYDKNSISSSGIVFSSIAADSNGNTWASYRDGVAKFDGNIWKTYKNIQLEEIVVNSITIDREDNKWLGTDKGVIKFDDTDFTKFRTTNSPLVGYITCLAADTNGIVWIGTKHGLGKYDGKKWTVYTQYNSGLPDNEINCLVIDKRQNKWIGTEHGLVKFNGKKWNLFKIHNRDFLRDVIDKIAVDSNGTIWAGGFSNYVPRNNFGHMYCPERPSFYGLAKFDGTKWTIYDSSNSGIPYSYVTSIAIAPNGNIWVGTFDSELFGERYFVSKYDKKKWKNFEMTNMLNIKDPFYNLNYNYIDDIDFDKTYNVWVRSQAGIAKFDGESWTICDTSKNVYSITFDQNGSRWICKYNSIIKYTYNDSIIYNIENSGFPGSANSIIIDKDGHKWFLTSNGIAELDDSSSER